MQLRPYQIDIVNKVRQDWQRTNPKTGEQFNDLLVVAATGAGKTQSFLESVLGGHGFDSLIANGERVLILAHRDELIQQPLERIKDYWPEWFFQTGVVKAGLNQCDRQIIIASVATVTQEHRLAKILAYGPISYVITDEAHHATADSYKRIYAALKATNPSVKHLGVTATPKRADETGLIEVFEHVSAKYGIKELVPQYLVPPKWLGIATNIKLVKSDGKAIDSAAGDFVAKQLADAFEVDNCFDIVVSSHQKYTAGRKSMAFTVSVKGAYALAQKFNEAGVSAIGLDGTTPREERRQILRDFHAGKYEVLCNCAVLTEGFDEPGVSCIHMVRPTKSDSLYTQIIGRGLRVVAGKQDCLILDYAPAEQRNLANLGDLLGAPRKVTETKNLLEAEPGDVIGGFTFDGELKGLRGNPLELVERQLNYLDTSTYIWDRMDGWLILSLGKNGSGVERLMAITPPRSDDPHKLYLLIKPDKVWEWSVSCLAEHEDFGEISDIAGAYADEHAVGVLAGKDQWWQKQPASEPQWNYIKKLVGKKGLLPGRLTKVEASKLIAQLQAKDALQKLGLWR
jgi:superfamily II DNA or RNA helicase